MKKAEIPDQVKKKRVAAVTVHYDDGTAQTISTTADDDADYDRRMTAKEAVKRAKRVKLSHHTVRDHIRAGKLASLGRGPRGCYLVSPRQLDDHYAGDIVEPIAAANDDDLLARAIGRHRGGA